MKKALERALYRLDSEKQGVVPFEVLFGQMKALGIEITNRVHLELIRRHEAVQGTIGQETTGLIKYKEVVQDLQLNPFSNKWGIRTYEQLPKDLQTQLQEKVGLISINYGEPGYTTF